MARIRIIATYEAATTFYRDLPPFLVEHGHDVTILMSSSEYRGGRASLPEALVGTGVRLDLVPGPKRVRGRAGKLLAMIRFFGGAIWRTLTGPRVDLDIYFSTPPLFAAWGMVVRAVHGWPFACLVQDVWPDVLAPGDRDLNRFHRVLRWVSRTTWRNADGVLVIGRCMRDVVIAGGASPRRVHLVGNWAPTETLDHDGSVRPLRDELGIDTDALLVMYAGNLGMAHTFSETVEVIDRLERDGLDVHWVFVGEGQRKGALQRAVAERALRNVSFLGFQPADVFPATLATGDVHLVTMRSGYEGLVVPSKTFAPWAVGRPVLYVGDPSGEIARTIVEEQVGVVVDNGDSDAMEQAVRAMVADQEQVANAGERAFAMSHGEGRFAPVTVMSQHAEAIDRILSGN